MGLLGATFLLSLIILLFFFPWTLSWDRSQTAIYLLSTTVFGTAWWIFRVSQERGTHKNTGGKNYSQIDRWLHWLALQPSTVRKLSFDMECLFALPEHPEERADGAVYVCGLARSGTTLLLQFLNQLDQFHSLTYRDMPFVLAPNLWGRINRHFPRKAMLAERAHGDGLLVGYDSPESFEEVFWRTFSNSASRHENTYGSDTVSNEALQAFAHYRAIVANPTISSNGKHRRYLSKNNNNLVRLHSLSTDPSATIILVYRNPVATARSLYRLHLSFCAEVGDDFVQRYMAWLGHHEFGHGHLPFSFARPRMNPALHPNNPDYWLDYWNAVYLHLLEQKDLRLNWINYDTMCQYPQEMLSAIFTLLATHAEPLAMAAEVRPPSSETKPPTEFNPELLSTANVTYTRLTENKANVFRPAAQYERIY
jgi:hypothetical protein